jgi:hypothetical protein
MERTARCGRRPRATWVSEVKQGERAAHAAIGRALALETNATTLRLDFKGLLIRFKALDDLTDEEQRRAVRAIARECQRFLADPGGV